MTVDDTHLDPRARRTLEALQVALGKHMRTQQLSQISVSEICRTAGVHRTTFYKHFESVADLAGLAVTDLIDRITTFDPEDGETDEHGRPRTARSYADWLAALVEHVGRRRETYRSILGPKGDPGLQRALSEHLVAKARLALESAAASEEDLAMDITAASLILGHGSFGAIVAMVTSDGLYAADTAEMYFSAMPESWRRIVSKDIGDLGPAPSSDLRGYSSVPALN